MIYKVQRRDAQDTSLPPQLGLQLADLPLLISHAELTLACGKLLHEFGDARISLSLSLDLLESGQLGIQLLFVLIILLDVSR